MAFVDIDHVDKPFINVTHRVGAKGDWDDLLVVQYMLDLVYTCHPVLRNDKPIEGLVTVSGKPAADTPVLIRHFQKVAMNRVKPEGFLNKAVGERKDNYAIWWLFMEAEFTNHELWGKEDNLIRRMRVEHHNLAPRLIEPTVIDVPATGIPGRWQVTVEGHGKKWIWIYTFKGKGKVTWRDPNNTKTGEGTWRVKGNVMSITWTGTTSTDSWDMPLNPKGQLGTCTMQGKSYNLDAVLL